MSYQQPPGYGTAGYGQPLGDHPKAQTAMILGILTFVCGCGIFTAIPAYIIGNNAVKEIDASGGQYGGRGMANAGKILGLVGIVLGIIGLIFWVIWFAVIAANA